MHLDLSLSGLQEKDLKSLAPQLNSALQAMQKLEAGSIANADEKRMVGHYWLRDPELAPQKELGEQIRQTLTDIEIFATAVHSGRVTPPEGGTFGKVLLIGIGGSALGPMLLANAFPFASNPMQVHVLDNTDPDGMTTLLNELGGLQDVMIVVVSKSGSTAESRNGMLEVQEACRQQGLDFAKRAVAITGKDSELHQRSHEEGWLQVFPMWDWVGGRTSLFSAVGMLPAALQGLNPDDLLAGAAAMDKQTRNPDLAKNPAAMLAAFWYQQGQGKGTRDMVVLPYKDRLQLLSRYLQQLVMESLGKEKDRQGKKVHQGLAVYGNKGSTDQHAYVQQLRDGLHNFFVLFLRVLEDRHGHSHDFEVEPGITSGDYLDGFLQGTRRALWESGRQSATLTLQRLDEASMGAIIALFERTVGLYAELVDVNAYHQPGVEAGKKAAGEVLALQRQILETLPSGPTSLAELAEKLGEDPMHLWPILQHLAANRPQLQMQPTDDPDGMLDPDRARFSWKA